MPQIAQQDYIYIPTQNLGSAEAYYFGKSFWEKHIKNKTIFDLIFIDEELQSASRVSSYNLDNDTVYISSGQTAIEVDINEGPTNEPDAQEEH